jgi:hypothetical protein
MLGLGGLSTVSTVVLVRSGTRATVSRGTVLGAETTVLVAVGAVLEATVLKAVGTVLEATVLEAVGPVANGVAPSVKATPRMLVGSSGRGLAAAAVEALGASVGNGGSLGGVDMVLAGSFEDRTR